MANQRKAQEKLMNALEKNLLALANCKDTSSAKSKELMSFGKLMNQKGPVTKPKKPDQNLYTVLKGKKCLDTDYVSMPAKKEDTKKEAKKVKRTPVNFLISPAKLGYSASHLTTSRPATVPAPIPCPTPIPAVPVNQWRERTGADLFTTPAASQMQNFNSGLEYEDELAMVIAESIRSAQVEERVRDMYFEQHHQTQHLLEQHQQSTYEAPPKEASCSSRSNDPFYFDDVPSKITPQEHDYLETAYGYNSDEDWITITSNYPCEQKAKKLVAKSDESVCAVSLKSGKKKAKKSHRKAQEEMVDCNEKTVKKSKKKQTEKDVNDSLWMTKGEESSQSCPETAPKNAGAIKKPKLNECKTEKMRISDDIDPGLKPGLANDAPKRTKSKSRKMKTEPSSGAELQFNDVSDQFSKPQREKKSSATSHKSKEKDSSANILHSYGVDNDFECNLEEDFEPYAIDHQAVMQPDPLESEKYNRFTETVSYVTINTHPHLFDFTNFSEFYGSSEDEFRASVLSLPDHYLRYFCKFTDSYQPMLSRRHIEDILESASHKVRSPDRPKSAPSLSSLDLSENDETDKHQNLKLTVNKSQGGVNKIDSLSSSSHTNSYSNEPLRRPRLTGSGHLKIPSTPAETKKAIQLSNSPAELQRMLCETTDLVACKAASTTNNFVQSKSDLIDASKFLPSLEPINEVNGPADNSIDLSTNQKNDQMVFDIQIHSALQTCVADEDLVDVVTNEIFKLKLDEMSPNIVEEIEKEVTKLMEDPKSSLRKFLSEKWSQISSNGDVFSQNTKESGSLPSLNSESLSPSEKITPLPVGLAFGSLQMEDIDPLSSSKNGNSLGLLQQNFCYNSAFPQINLQSNINAPVSRNDSFTLSTQSCFNLASAAAENGMTALPYSLMRNPKNMAGNEKLSDTLSKVPFDNAVPTSAMSGNAIAGTTSIDQHLSLEAVINSINLTVLEEAGENANALINSTEYQSLLPIVAVSVLNEAKQCATPDDLIQSFSRDFVRHFILKQPETSYMNQAHTSSSHTSQTQTPPGLSLPTSQSLYPFNPVSVNDSSSNSAVQGPPGFPQGYATSYAQSSIRNDVIQTNIFPTAYPSEMSSGLHFATGAPSVYSSNNIPETFNGPGMTSSLNSMQNQIPANFNML